MSFAAFMSKSNFHDLNSELAFCQHDAIMCTVLSLLITYDLEFASSPSLNHDNNDIELSVDLFSVASKAGFRSAYF